jgi:hypothetical protein
LDAKAGCIANAAPPTAAALSKFRLVIVKPDIKPSFSFVSFNMLCCPVGFSSFSFLVAFVVLYAFLLFFKASGVCPESYSFDFFGTPVQGGLMYFARLKKTLL